MISRAFQVVLKASQSGDFALNCAFQLKMWSLKFKAQPTNAFFVTVNQMFGGSSQHPATAERVVIKSLNTVKTTKQYSTVVGSWEDKET